MATISGNLIDATGTGMVGVPIDFILATAPLDAAGTLVSGKPVRITTGASGAYSTTLRQGLYRVRIPSNPESTIAVPSGSGTYAIGAIAVYPDAAFAGDFVWHPTTLTTATSYTYLVGTRAAGATVTLPDPGTASQRIVVVDASGQAATWNITINAGTKSIESGGPTTLVVSKNNAVVTLVYAGGFWALA